MGKDSIRVGIDLGSRTIKVVLMRLHSDDKVEVIARRLADNTGAPRETAEIALNQLLEEHGLDTAHIERYVMTGYGRYLFGVNENTYPETVCMVRGLIAQMPDLPAECTILDLGGQDTKVARVFRDRPIKYKLNDFCAAGTGRFLENIARVMGLTVEKMAEIACQAKGMDESLIKSRCAVFVESEVVEKIARGYPLPVIAAAVHNTLVDHHIKQMLNSVSFTPPLHFLGGVAHNMYMVKRLSELYGQVIVPDDCQLLSAIGAVLYDRDQHSR